MDPLEVGDTGGLGNAIDGLTHTVRSAGDFADAVNEVTSFELVLPLLYILLGVIVFNRILKFLQGWSDGGARRYAEGRPVFSRKAASYEEEIAELKRIVAEQGRRLAELAGVEEDEPADRPEPGAPRLEIVSAREK